jgi:hypothetical protein
MPTSVYFNNQEASREQLLLEDMVIESIKNHGIDIYYMPRSSRDFPAGQLDDYTKHLKGIDDLFGDDPVKYYDSAYKIDMYLETFNDYGGQQEFFSKFGLQVEKTARVAVARRTFEKYVTTRNLPKEGDLIYLPAQRKLMEIRFVERDISFFQLGKRLPYMYVLSLETFKYNGELLNTGITEIDFVCDDTALSTNFLIDTSTMTDEETYDRGEVVWQGPAGDFANANCTAFVTNFNKTTSDIYNEYVDGPMPAETLRLRNIKGEFTVGQPIYGIINGASANLVSYNILKTATEGEVMDNWQIEEEADTILDFSETNPFGEP